MKAKTKQPFNKNGRKMLLPTLKRLHQCHAVVVGAGAMGRAVAILLASLGVRHMSLYDPAKVTRKHLTQGFMDFDIGSAKVDAVANSAHQLNPHMELLTYRSRFLLSHLQEWRLGYRNAVFLCGGTLPSHKSSGSWAKQTAHFICEARLGADEIRLLTSTKPPYEINETALVTDKPDRSTSDLVMANLSACLMVYLFARWLQNLPVSDQHFRLC
ncbi:MAG: ThiF family adenylyltransferase [Gemmatales bacterium]